MQSEVAIRTLKLSQQAHDLAESLETAIFGAAGMTCIEPKAEAAMHRDACSLVHATAELKRLLDNAERRPSQVAAVQCARMQAGSRRG